eukprot:TRINITY_DN7088_c0_g3_i8.p1 TRINITY_DN7088_c0_g3~~TRINITY_DN7088_c0_g3_i8.p1  ORF type:complete len:615 (-),score=136.44 TRINITY_DN7088_c0_g3_i8:415-2259(-)
MPGRSSALHARTNWWTGALGGRIKWQQVASSQDLLDKEEQGWKQSTLMNARGMAESLTETLGDSVEMEAFDPRTVMLTKLQDIQQLLEIALQHLQRCISLSLFMSSTNSQFGIQGFSAAQNATFPRRIWLLPLNSNTVEPGCEVTISWRHVGIIPLVQIEISHDLAGEHRVTGDFWKRTPITPGGGIQNTGSFTWPVETDKPGDFWVYISAVDVVCPTDSLELTVQKAEVLGFEKPSPSTWGAITWVVGVTQPIEVRVAELVKTVAIVAVWRGKDDQVSLTQLLSPTAACSNGLCKFEYRVPLEMYAAQQLAGFSHWELQSFVPDPLIELESGLPGMSLGCGCVSSGNIKLKLKPASVSNLVLSNTSGFARRRANWVLGSTQQIKWRSQGFECNQVKLLLEPTELKPDETFKRIEIAAAADNSPGMNQVNWIVQLPAELGQSWVGRDLRVKARLVPDMGQLRHQTCGLYNLRDDQTLSWPDASDVVEVNGVTSVILHLDHDQEEAPPEYEEPPEEVGHWEGEYSDVNHPDGVRRIGFTSLARDELMIAGHDGDEAQPWQATGMVLTGESILVDLSSKGGPSALEGRWTGSGICWVMDGEEELENDGSDSWIKTV